MRQFTAILTGPINGEGYVIVYEGDTVLNPIRDRVRLAETEILPFEKAKAFADHINGCDTLQMMKTKP